MARYKKHRAKNFDQEFESLIAEARDEALKYAKAHPTAKHTNGSPENVRLHELEKRVSVLESMKK